MIIIINGPCFFNYIIFVTHKVSKLETSLKVLKILEMTWAFKRKIQIRISISVYTYQHKLSQRYKPLQKFRHNILFYFEQHFFNFFQFFINQLAMLLKVYYVNYQMFAIRPTNDNLEKKSPQISGTEHDGGVCVRILQTSDSIKTELAFISNSKTVT